jgi:plastocyanin
MFFRVSSILGMAVLITACGGSSPAPSPSPNPPPSGGSSVSIVSGASTLTTTAFSPNPTNVSAGTTITWVNHDGTIHTATSSSGAFDTQGISPGATSRGVTFSTPGTFQYRCSIHPNMVGTINVQ